MTTTAPPAAPPPAPAPTKPGYQTTELLVVILTDVGLVVSSAVQWLPPRYAAIGATIASAAYAIARGLAKSGTPGTSA